jgi:hypothetical protein
MTLELEVHLGTKPDANAGRPMLIDRFNTALTFEIALASDLSLSRLQCAERFLHFHFLPRYRLTSLPTLWEDKLIHHFARGHCLLFTIQHRSLTILSERSM